MQKKPSVIVFFTDQQRWNSVGCYGSSMHITPHLDETAHFGSGFSRLDRKTYFKYRTSS